MVELRVNREGEEEKKNRVPSSFRVSAMFCYFLRELEEEAETERQQQ